MDYKQIQSNPVKLREFSKRLFLKVDKNHNGQVSADELNCLMTMVAKEINSRLPTPQEIQTIINKVDRNNDNQISMDEFVSIAELLMQLLG